MVLVASPVVSRFALLGLEDEAFVQQAYMYCLDRPVDYAGLEIYRAHLAAGMPKEVILAELEASAEGKRVFMRRGTRMAVAVAPTVPLKEMDSFLAPVSGKESSPRLHSAEVLLSQAGDEAFLRAAYITLLGRDIDPSGFANYLAKLLSGVSRMQIIFELATSPEGHASGQVLDGLDAILASFQHADATSDVRHVNELLGLQLQAFVPAAYRAVLMRDTDAEGGALYSGLLRQGWSRSYVLKELFLSVEGRAVKSLLPGLRALVRRYGKAQANTLLGWYHRSVKGAESDLPQDRALRAALLAAAR